MYLTPTFVEQIVFIHFSLFHSFPIVPEYLHKDKQVRHNLVWIRRSDCMFIVAPLLLMMVDEEKLCSNKRLDLTT